MQTRKEPGLLISLLAFAGLLLLLYFWSVGLVHGGVQKGINYTAYYLIVLAGVWFLVRLFFWIKYLYKKRIRMQES